MVRRAAVVLALLIATRVYSAHAVSAEAPVFREPLSALPLAVGEWNGHDAPPLADDVLGQLRVDDYVNREYVNAAGLPVGLYVGYYASQRQGDTIHSPQNCLPGAGWQPIETGVTELRLPAGSVRVNRFQIQKGLDRQIVLYWYQGRGRVVANEYTNKALLMLDAARIHRSNGGLVRLIAPVATTTEAAETTVSGFATALFPHLDRYLP